MITFSLPTTLSLWYSYHSYKIKLKTIQDTKNYQETHKQNTLGLLVWLQRTKTYHQRGTNVVRFGRLQPYQKSKSVLFMCLLIVFSVLDSF